MLSLPHEPLFLADWHEVLMIHYEVDPKGLQTALPFELDRWDGRAFVSLVAFTMQRMRPRFGGRLAEMLFRPISTHEFLNVRTYVRHNGEPGIFFMAEWLSNRLSVALGPRAFGLPYRFGHIHYKNDPAARYFAGTVQSSHPPARLEYHANTHRPSPVTRRSFQPCEAGSLEEWLMERYTAFTCRSGKTRRFFRVWHRPWLQVPLKVELNDQSLLERNWCFFRDAEVIGGNFSPGVDNVWMGWPHRVGTE